MISIYLLIINGQSVYSMYSFDVANSSEQSFYRNAR